VHYGGLLAVALLLGASVGALFAVEWGLSIQERLFALAAALKRKRSDERARA
jgi:H+/Cl- antiporter ClcA